MHTCTDGCKARSCPAIYVPTWKHDRTRLIQQTTRKDSNEQLYYLIDRSYKKATVKTTKEYNDYLDKYGGII